MQKLASVGTSDPLVARVSFQWVEILDWFELSRNQRESALTALLVRIQPRLIACRETGAELVIGLERIFQKSADAPSVPAIEQKLNRVFDEAHQALKEFEPVIGYLVGKGAPTENLLALALWAEKEFGGDADLTQLLKTANTEGIGRMSSLIACKASGAPVTLRIGTSLAETTWRSDKGDYPITDALQVLVDNIVRFIEDVVMAALRHVPTRASVTFVEIPETDRDKSAPIRYRAMTEGSTGKMVPAGKFSQAGNLVPELQRLIQQGRGRPIIATRFKNEWFVASGSKLYHSPKWKNFHDFLGFYIKDILGGSWANLELKKPREHRHPLMNWYEDVVRYTNEHIKAGRRAPMTSLPAAYLGLAYNLYLISHNNGKVHELLIRRLKHRDQFHGAYLEVVVTGMMIRAGFDIELEDETDSNTSHCEFTATHRESGQKLSVEVKMRLSKKQPPEVGNQLYNALRKEAKHPRLVFIEINDEQSAPESQDKILHAVLADIRRRETNLTIDGQPAPPAYLVVMNNPPATVERMHAHGCMVEGFKMPDFRVEGAYASIPEALDARRRHIAMFALIDALRRFNRIPVTFDGETEAYAEGRSHGRLVLGNRYCIQLPDGDVSGELIQAVVMTDTRTACCVLSENGRNQIVMVPLSDQEMQAYNESPRTFFGREEPEKKLEDPLKLYDWLYESYEHNTKEHLLGLLTQMGCKDLDALKSMTRERLAVIFAERTTESIVIQSGRTRLVKKPSEGPA